MRQVTTPTNPRTMRLARNQGQSLVSPSVLGLASAVIGGTAGGVWVDGWGAAVRANMDPSVLCEQDTRRVGANGQEEGEQRQGDAECGQHQEGVSGRQHARLNLDGMGEPLRLLARAGQQVVESLHRLKAVLADLVDEALGMERTTPALDEFQNAD